MHHDTQTIQQQGRLRKVQRENFGRKKKLEEGAILSSKEAQKRFWSKVRKTTGCWLWTAYTGNGGYGYFGLENGNMKGAHRISWVLANGIIPSGLWVCHKCDNPPCVNPSHLFLGTALDNNRDRDRKGRFHPLCGPENGNYGGLTAARGIRQHLAKLTDKIVISARREYASGKTTKAALALKFGVTDVAMGNAINRKTWTHV